MMALVLAALVATQAAAKPENADRIAVARFRSTGVSQEVADGVADVLSIELEKFRGVDLLTRDDMRSVLDKAAENQLLGCEDPQCFVDASKLVPSRRLLTGSIVKLGNALVVQAALIDLVDTKVLARASATLAGGSDDIASALRTIAVGLINGDPTLMSSNSTIKGEVDADMLDRVRIAQRERGPAFHAFAGGVYSTTFAIGNPSDPAYPGGAGHLAASLPVLSWLSVVATLGGGYYTGKFVNQATFTFTPTDGTVPTPPDTNGAFESSYAVADANASLGVELEAPTGFVRPYARAALSGDVLRLDISDLAYVPNPGQPQLKGLGVTQFQPSIAPGVGLELAAGTDFNLGEHFGLSAELAGYDKVHGLNKVFKQANVVKQQPLAPLVGVTLLVGVFYEM